MEKLTEILTILIVGLALISSCSSDQKKIESFAEEMTQEIPEVAASEESDEEEDVPTAGLPIHLEQCTPYSETFIHPFSGEELKKEVIGLIGNGLCEYKEEMPNGGVMECKYSEPTRKVMAQYYKEIAFSGLGSLDFNTRKYTIEGKTVTNPLDEVLDNGNCTILGY